MFLLPKLLARLVDEGPLTLIGPDGSRRSFGSPSPHVKPVTIRIRDGGDAGRSGSNGHRRPRP